MRIFDEIEYLPEFTRELNKLSKKRFRTLQKDLENFIDTGLKLLHKKQQDYGGIVEISDIGIEYPKIYKVLKFTCRSLKGRGVIVIFDPEDVAQIDNVNLTRGAKYLKPAYIFELGTEKTSDTSTHFQNDLEKLTRQVKGGGYIIHIYKDITQARTGTLSRRKTENKIKQRFKKAFNGEKSGEKIKILAILLRTYRNQTKMRGKCEIFNGCAWPKVNISRGASIRSAILERLA